MIESLKERLDIQINNAVIYDGSGSPPYKASLGIKDNKIAHIGSSDSGSSLVIDAHGLALCPGFIDTHGHSEFTVLAAPQCESKIVQGVTTEINGNCGLSGAPLLGPAKERREDDIREFDIAERWSDLDEYFSILERRKPAINFATLTGHGNIRSSVKGYSDGKATDSELSDMLKLAERSVSSGSLGFSTGLVYPPGVFTDTDELIRLFGSVSNSENLIYTTHMRSEGDRLIESIRESLDMGKESGMKIHISHLKTGGKSNWHKVDDALKSINAGIDEGLSVSFDRYPYTGAATDLDIMLPAWSFEGGKEEELKRLRDGVARNKLINHMKSNYKGASGFEGVIVSSVMTGKNRWIEGKSIAEIAKALKKSPEDTVLDILVDEDLRASAIFMSMNEDNLRKILSHPLCMIGSDSAVRNYTGITAKGSPHPRGFGSFPCFLGKYVRDEGLMTLEEGVRRITLLPAETFGIKGRGIIKEGYYADIVLFDPDTIRDTATYGRPFSKPAGISYVLVNGRLAVSEGELTDTPGSGMILKANN